MNVVVEMLVVPGTSERQFCYRDTEHILLTRNRNIFRTGCGRGNHACYCRSRDAGDNFGGRHQTGFDLCGWYQADRGRRNKTYGSGRNERYYGDCRSRSCSLRDRVVYSQCLRWRRNCSFYSRRRCWSRHSHVLPWFGNGYNIGLLTVRRMFLQ